MTPLEILKHHVTGAIERGEKEAIQAIERKPMKASNQGKQMEREIRSLLIRLKREIGDDYRASDDPGDNTPGMQVTFATTDGESWSYQTGDNSYTGGCYSHPHWSVISLYRRDNCTEHARYIVDELLGMVEDAKRYQTV